MKRRTLVARGVALAAAGVGSGVAWWHYRSEASPADAAFWNMTFERPGGGELVMATMRGKPLLLNFWATWCAPCIKEMPLLDKFHEERQAQGWQVVGLAIDSPTPVREFLARLPIRFPIGLAGMEGVELTRNLGNASGSLPFTVVFDRTGRVFDRKLGIVQPQDLARWTRTKLG